MRAKKALIALTCASLLTAAPAAAQTASDGYSKPSGSIEERIAPERSPSGTTIEAAEDSPQASEGGALPFTGRDLLMIVAAGGVLVGMGLGLRRLSHLDVA